MDSNIKIFDVDSQENVHAYNIITLYIKTPLWYEITKDILGQPQRRLHYISSYFR